jgi:hypothetical protein
MPAVRKPASTETAVQLCVSEGWTQSFARTRGRSRAQKAMLPAACQEVKRASHFLCNIGARIAGEHMP